MRAAAAEMILDFGNGQEVTFHRKNVTSYDAVADVETTGAEIVVSVPCVIVPRAANDRSTPYNDLTLTNFLKILVPATGLGVFLPAPGDQIEVPGEADRFTVTDVKTIRPDGVAVVHTLQAEKGATT
jgi:sulfur carrier protein ThiS